MITNPPLRFESCHAQCSALDTCHAQVMAVVSIFLLGPFERAAASDIAFPSWWHQPPPLPPIPPDLLLYAPTTTAHLGLFPRRTSQLHLLLLTRSLHCHRRRRISRHHGFRRHNGRFRINHQCCSHRSCPTQPPQRRRCIWGLGLP